MKQRALADLTVSAIGLGAMPLTMDRPHEAAPSPRSTPRSTPA